MAATVVAVMVGVNRVTCTDKTIKNRPLQREPVFLWALKTRRVLSFQDQLDLMPMPLNSPVAMRFSHSAGPVM